MRLSRRWSSPIQLHFFKLAGILRRQTEGSRFHVFWSFCQIFWAAFPVGSIFLRSFLPAWIGFFAMVPLAAGLPPIVYYFPLLWKTKTVCQDGFVLRDPDPHLNEIKLKNLGVDFGQRVLCEEECQTGNFNGFLNFAKDLATCRDAAIMRYHCDCKSGATSCLGDSIRLTQGTNGFLEIFGYDSDRDQTGWFPVCYPTYNPSSVDVQNIAKVVCTTLGFNYEETYGLTLPLASTYKAATIFFSYDVFCATGNETKLRECVSTRRALDTVCPTGNTPLHIRCTDNGKEPRTVRHVISLPASYTKPAQFEMFEATVGRWTSVSEMGWSPVENDRACRQAGKLDLFGASRMYSCKQYFDYFRSRDIQAQSGLYQIMIDGVFYPVPCDMDVENPGWTMVFNNTMDRYWTRATAESLNVMDYQVGSSYSNLARADKIVSKFPGMMYDVKIDAHGEGVNSSGLVFRLPKTESLLTSKVTPIQTIIHQGPRFKQDPDSGFILSVPHFSPWVDGNSIYGMSNHTRPASRFGNLIARSKSPTKKQYRYWVPGPIDPPEYTSMWLREVSDDKTEESCQDRKYLFESSDFNRRQIFASSSTPGFEPWKSHLGGVGWVSTLHSTTAQAQEWIMVDLLRVHKIGMIAIAGVTVKQETYWLSKFNVAIKSRWSDNWVKQGTVYKGNTDATTITEVKLKPPIVTRFIKIIPLNFHGHIGLRWTVFGCPRGPVYPPEYLLASEVIYSYLAAGPFGSYINGQDTLEEETSYFQRTACTHVKLELNLQRPTIITGLIFTGNPYSPSVVTGIKVYTSADGSRENLKIVHGTLRGEATTGYSMVSPNEPIYVTVDRFGARMIRLVFNRACPFRFELVGVPIPDWCNLPLGISDQNYGLNVSTTKEDLPFYGLSQLSIDSVMTEAGFGEWVPKVTDVGPWVKIDLKELFTITALAVGRQAEQTEWTDFRVSYAMVVEQWKFHGDITKSLLIGRGDGQERVTVNLNPPIGQARYVKLDLAGSAISLKLELFGCKVPPSRSSSLPGMNVLRRTKLTPLDENATMTVQSLRESFNQSGGFVYNSVKGSSSEVLLPSDPTTTGYARDLELDLYWPNTKVEPDWGVRPLISNLKCEGPQPRLEQCTWRHAHDDPSSPSSAIIPNCSTYCGDPGRISQTRKKGFDFAYPSAPVTYECLYDFLATRIFSLSTTCRSDGQWSDEAVRCPMYQELTLGENRPLLLSSVDVELSWLAKSWTPRGKTWHPAQLKCQAAKRETYPWVMVDLKAPVQVQKVTIDFGIGEDLPNSDLDILVSNSGNPRLALEDICHRQRNTLMQMNGSRTFSCQHELIGRYVYVTFRDSDQTNLFICNVGVEGPTTSPHNNLAEFQKAKKSSLLLLPASQDIRNTTGAHHFAHLAVDGNTDLTFDSENFGSSSCAATSHDSRETWWAVDLGQESAVYGLSIYLNSSLYAPTDSLEVQVSSTEPPTATYDLCAILKNITYTSFPLRTLCTDKNNTPIALYGRHVTLALTGESALVLCEVRVWGRNCTEYLDRAVFKPVLSSSTLDTSSGSYLVNGNNDTQFATDYESEPTVTIDLIGTYQLDNFEVSTGDVAMFKLRVMTSTLYNDSSFQLVQPAVNTTANQFLIIPVPATHPVARYIRLSVSSNSTTSVSLQLRFVRAISRACAESSQSRAVTYRNLVLNSETLMTSAADGLSTGHPLVTVDGIKFPRHTLCWSSSQNVRWQIRLPEKATVYRVSLYGGFTTTLSVTVEQVLCGSVTSMDNGIKEMSVVCGVRNDGLTGLEGRDISVQPKDVADVLVTLCEVEVWGTTT